MCKGSFYCVLYVSHFLCGCVQAAEREGLTEPAEVDSKLREAQNKIQQLVSWSHDHHVIVI